MKHFSNSWNPKGTRNLYTDSRSLITNRLVLLLEVANASESGQKVPRSEHKQHRIKQKNQK